MLSRCSETLSIDIHTKTLKSTKPVYFRPSCSYASAFQGRSRPRSSSSFFSNLVVASDFSWLRRTHPSFEARRRRRRRSSNPLITTTNRYQGALTTMADTTIQYQATQKGGPFAVASVPKSSVGPKQVAIHMKAIGLNPLDWKKLYFGAMVESWPAVFGIDGSGIVDAVGEGVSKFKAGDEVFSLFGHEDKASSFQELAVVPEMYVAKKPANVSFEETASLPICYCTAASAIYAGLQIPLSYLPNGATTGPQPRSILVLGGSSGVGASAIQILRLSLPTAIILTTSSSRHHPYLRSLGASQAFDQRSPSLISDIRSAASDGQGVDMILDAVASSASQTDIFDTLRADGPKEYAEVFTGTPTQVPDGVKRHVVFGRKLFETPGGENAMSALAELVGRGEYKIPVPVRVVGTGFEAIAAGLEELKKGVSLMKLVVTV